MLTSGNIEMIKALWCITEKYNARIVYRGFTELFFCDGLLKGKRKDLIYHLDYELLYLSTIDVLHPNWDRESNIYTSLTLPNDVVKTFMYSGTYL